jgi:hypothetical protein
MTGLEKLCRANRWRIRAANPEHPSKLATSDADGWNGHFLVPLEGDIWHIILCDQLGWKHLTISNAQQKVSPSWNIMCRVKELFYADEEWAVQFHPPKEGSQDDPYRLHLWAPLDEVLPVPMMVLI